LTITPVHAECYITLIPKDGLVGGFCTRLNVVRIIVAREQEDAWIARLGDLLITYPKFAWKEDDRGL